MSSILVRLAIVEIWPLQHCTSPFTTLWRIWAGNFRQILSRLSIYPDFFFRFFFFEIFFQNIFNLSRLSSEKNILDQSKIFNLSRLCFLIFFQIFYRNLEYLIIKTTNRGIHSINLGLNVKYEDKQGHIYINGNNYIIPKLSHSQAYYT